jgi:small basic protein (TIGR04137 family)
MSQHPSLKSASRIRAKRNVLKRFERIDILRERGEWNEDKRGYGLRKTKIEA